MKLEYDEMNRLFISLKISFRKFSDLNLDEVALGTETSNNFFLYQWIKLDFYRDFLSIGIF